MVIGLIQWGNKQVGDQLAKLTNQYCTKCCSVIEYRKQFVDSLVVEENRDKTWTVTEMFREDKASYVISGSGTNIKCSCRGYERDGIACRHILVLEAKGTLQSPPPKPIYLSMAIRQALHGTELIPDRARLTETEVHEPTLRPNAGRPRRRRYKSKTEDLMAARKRTYRCSICKRTGHTVKTHHAWERAQHIPPMVTSHNQQPSGAASKQRPMLRTFTFDRQGFENAQQNKH